MAAEGEKLQQETRPKPGSSKAARSDVDVGSALRAAYQKAVDEKIPQEMLDLLGKLS